MKTKQLINLAFLSGLLLAAGCSDDQHTGTTDNNEPVEFCLLYTSPSPRDA